MTLGAALWIQMRKYTPTWSERLFLNITSAQINERDPCFILWLHAYMCRGSDTFSPQSDSFRWCYNLGFHDPDGGQNRPCTNRLDYGPLKITTGMFLLSINHALNICDISSMTFNTAELCFQSWPGSECVFIYDSQVKIFWSVFNQKSVCETNCRTPGVDLQSFFFNSIYMHSYESVGRQQPKWLSYVFFHEISRMQGKPCNSLTKLLWACIFTNYCLVLDYVQPSCDVSSFTRCNNVHMFLTFQYCHMCLGIHSLPATFRDS